MMSLKEMEIQKEMEKKTQRCGEESPVGLARVLVIIRNLRLEVRSAHVLRTGNQASILYLLDLITLAHRPAWIPGQPPLQDREVHLPFP
jgi:hypothetical protein